MKKIICLLFALLLSRVIIAQDIGSAEFFIDTDPGYGNATAINIAAPAAELTLNFDINTNTLSNGWHRIGIRAKNNLGKWGTLCNRMMFLMKLPPVDDRKIGRAEYFFDSDPGFGKAHAFAVSSPDFELSLSATADLTGLSTGMHHLGIRSADLTGRWGVLTNRMFFYAKTFSSAKVSKAEYFIDTDPGFGKGKPFTVSTPGADLSLDITDELAGLEQGMHYLVIRAMDEGGRWGTSIMHVFYFLKLPNTEQAKVHQLEYFYDSDPGIGKGTAVGVTTPDNDVNISLNADVTGLSPGDHIIYLRAKNALNQWGHLYAEAFSYTTTGIDRYEIASIFKIFPNPGKSNFKIQFTENQISHANISIRDMQGCTVFKKQYAERPENLSLNLPSGLYLVEIENGKKIFSQKLIIE